MKSYAEAWNVLTDSSKFTPSLAICRLGREESCLSLVSTLPASERSGDILLGKFTFAMDMNWDSLEMTYATSISFISLMVSHRWFQLEKHLQVANESWNDVLQSWRKIRMNGFVTIWSFSGGSQCKQTNDPTGQRKRLNAVASSSQKKLVEQPQKRIAPQNGSLGMRHWFAYYTR